MQPTLGIPCKIKTGIGLVHHQNINGFNAYIMLADSKPELRKSNTDVTKGSCSLLHCERMPRFLCSYSTYPL